MPALSLPDRPLTDGVVVIRERRESDSDAFIAACQDPEISRWTLVPENYTREVWDEWQVRSAQAARDGSGLHVGIFDTEDNVLGAIGLVEFDLERRYTEIGYWLAKEARGKGYAARAVRLLTAWAQRELGVRTVELLIDPANANSRRVAIAAGFIEDGIRPGPARCGHADVVVHVSSVP